MRTRTLTTGGHCPYWICPVGGPLSPAASERSTSPSGSWSRRGQSGLGRWRQPLVARPGGELVQHIAMGLCAWRPAFVSANGQRGEKSASRDSLWESWFFPSRFGSERLRSNKYCHVKAAVTCLVTVMGSVCHLFSIPKTACCLFLSKNVTQERHVKCSNTSLKQLWVSALGQHPRQALPAWGDVAGVSPPGHTYPQLPLLSPLPPTASAPGPPSWPCTRSPVGLHQQNEIKPAQVWALSRIRRRTHLARHVHLAGRRESRQAVSAENQ